MYFCCHCRGKLGYQVFEIWILGYWPPGCRALVTTPNPSFRALTAQSGWDIDQFYLVYWDIAPLKLGYWDINTTVLESHNPNFKRDEVPESQFQKG